MPTADATACPSAVRCGAVRCATCFICHVPRTSRRANVVLQRVCANAAVVRQHVLHRRMSGRIQSSTTAPSEAVGLADRCCTGVVLRHSRQPACADSSVVALGCDAVAGSVCWSGLVRAGPGWESGAGYLRVVALAAFAAPVTLLRLWQGTCYTIVFADRHPPGNVVCETRSQVTNRSTP